MRRAVLTAISVGLLLIQACGGNERAPLWNGSSPAATSNREAATDAGDAGSTDVLPPATELCVGLSGNQSMVDESGVPWGPPTMLGGAIQLGTYDLTELVYFRVATVDRSNSAQDGGVVEADASSLAIAPTGRSARSTLVIERYVLRRLALWSGEAESAQAFLYSAEGSTLSLSSVCPTRGSQANYGYSVVGDSLSLLVDPQHLEIYSRR
jgi:hypothetical protein